MKSKFLCRTGHISSVSVAIYGLWLLCWTERTERSIITERCIGRNWLLCLDLDTAISLSAALIPSPFSAQKQ